MPSPSTSLATLRPDLAGSFEEFDLAMDRNGFIATQVLPIMDVAKPSGTFGIIPIEQLLANRGNIQRAPGAGYARSKWTFTEGSYLTTEYGVEEPIDDKEQAMYSNFFDVELISAQRALDGLLREEERRAAAAVFNTTTWTGATLTTAVSVPWSTIATATPITDVDNAKRKVYAITGIWPDTLVLTRSAFMYLRNCAQIIDRIKYSGLVNPQLGTITAGVIAQALDIDRIVIAGSTKNTANEGVDATLASIWDNTMAMVCHTAQTNDIREPCVGRTFHWAEDGSQPTGTVETYRDEPIRGDVVRVRHEVQEKILYPGMGHLLTAVTA